MFRVLHITAGGRLKLREGRKERQWHKEVNCSYHTGATSQEGHTIFFLFALTFSASESSNTPSPFCFSSYLNWFPTHPFDDRAFTLPLLSQVTHAPTHFPGAPAHSFTWFKYGNTCNTHTSLKVCVMQLHMHKCTHLKTLMFYFHPPNYLVLGYTWYKRKSVCIIELN